MSNQITKEDFITGLNTIRLRAQDLNRHLKLLELQGMEAGLIKEISSDFMYDMNVTLVQAAQEINKDFNIKHFVGIETPEGLAMLIHEESDQVQAKVREMAQMTGVSMETLEAEGLYSGFHLGDAADHMYEVFTGAVKK